MKVLHINAVSGIRSTGRLCAEIADYLNDNGQEGYIAYSCGLRYKKGYKIGTRIGSKFHGLYSRIFGLQAYFSTLGTIQLLNYIKKLKPDVVHLHNLHSNYINLVVLLNYLGKKDIPTVVTLHDCWFFTGKCTHYTVDGCYKWESGCRKCPRLKKDNPSWFFDCTKKMYLDKKKYFKRIPRLAVVGVSDWIKNEAKRSFLASSKKVIRIYNWINTDIFKPIDTDDLRKNMKLKNKFIILGVASVWGNEKGLDKFIQLANGLQDDMVIVLVGNINSIEKLPDNMINVSETHNINELVAYYSMADVLLNLSVEETFGNVSAEALSCGTPIIAFNATANSELVGEGCGYIVEMNDMEDVENAITKIYQLGKPNYSVNCITFAKENFNKEERIKDYLRLYQKLIKNFGEK